MASPTEELNRINRAIPIVFALIASGNTAQDARLFDLGTEAHKGKDSKMWRMAAHLADIRDYVPGTDTQKLIIKLLDDYGRMQRHMTPRRPMGLDITPIAEYLDWAVETTEPDDDICPRCALPREVCQCQC